LFCFRWLQLYIQIIRQFAAANLMKIMTAVDDTALNEEFSGQEDGFHGITFDSSKEKCDISVFPVKREGNILWRYIFQ